MLGEAASPGFNFPGEPSIDGAVPDGYRLTVQRRELGRGRELFELAADAVLYWQVHRRSGFVALDVLPAKVALGAVSRWRIPSGPIRPVVICRVFAVVREPERGGYGHGALDGHPQRGWESFIVTLEEDRVILTIRVV